MPMRERSGLRRLAGAFGALLSHSSAAGLSSGVSDAGSDLAPHRTGKPLVRPGDLLGGRFRIATLLGQGGMGCVYAAEDTLVHTTIAIKVIRPEFVAVAIGRDRLIRELRLARQVTHPHVCRVYDIAEVESNGEMLVILTMELLHGETLSERLERRPPLTPDEAESLSVQLAEALGSLHTAGIVHRDFKPANVMLIRKASGLHAVVMDFGLAHPAEPAQGDRLTQPGGIAGTLAYMAPEQTAGMQATAASDVCALGIVIARMITGLGVHSAIERSASGLRLTVAADAILKRVAPAWRKVVLRCLETDPERRHPTAVVLRTALMRPSAGARRRTVLLFAFGAAAFTACTLGARWYFVSPLPADRHVAVLPFRQVSGKPLSSSALEGAAEALSQKLAACCTSASLWFVPESEVRALGTGPNERIGRALGVNLLLAGEISQAEGKLVVTLAVRDAAVNRTLRSASLRLDRQDLASGETAISNRAAALLGVNLVSSRDRRPASISPGARQYREQALSYSARRDDASLVIATDFLRRSIAADALYSDAYADLARVLILRYSNARDAALLVEAEEVCDKARRIGGESPGLLLADSRIAGFRGDSPDAMRLLQRSLDLDPHNADALSALARLFDEAGRTLNAEQTYQRAIEAHSGDWKVYTSLGHFYQTHGLNADAEKNFRIAYDLAPDSPRAISNLGALLLYMHRNEDAVVLLRHGLEVRPTAAGYSNLGTVLFFSGQYLQAAEAYRKAVALAPSDDRYRRNLGDAYLRLNDLPAAKTAWSDAVDLVSQQMRREPGNPVLGASRALYLAKCGRAAEARAQVASSLNSHAADPALLFRCAVALELCANRLGAIRLLKDAFAHGLALSEVQTAAELDELREDPGFIHIAPPETPNK